MNAMAERRRDTRRSRQLLGFLCRFALLALILATLTHRYEFLLAQRLLPAIQEEIQWLDDTYEIKSLDIDHEGADQVVRMVVSQARCIVLTDRAFCGDPRGRANASTLVGNITLPAVLLIALTLAWPATHAAEYALRIVLVPMAVAAMWAIDVPFALWSAIWSLHVDAYAPGMFSPLLIWSQFLQGGGREMLALLLGIAVAWGAKQLAQVLGRVFAEGHRNHAS